MESLPEEMVEKLCDFISDRDLVTCSAVCREWRRIFSYDSIWKPRCSQNKSLELDDHLRSTPCVVEPPFATPEVEVTESLSGPPNRWKVACFREKHLWNNWQNGRSKEFEVTRIVEKNVSAIRLGFLSNDLVYIVFLHHFEVWNVRNVPAMEVSKTAHTLTRDEVFSFTVIVGESQNLGFTINRRTRIRTFCLNTVSGFISEMSTFQYAKIPTGNAFDQSNRFAILGSTFIGIIGGTTTLHIWDLESCTKLREEEVGASQLLVHLFSTFEVTDALVVVTSNTTENRDPNGGLVYIYRIYSPPKQQFLDFNAESKLSDWCRCSLLKDFIAVLDTEFRVFNFQTSELIFHYFHSVNDPESPGISICRTVGPYFYHPEGYFNPVTKTDKMSLTGTVECVTPLQQLRALGKTCCVESFIGFLKCNIFCHLQNDKLEFMRINDFPMNGELIGINQSCSRLFYYQEQHSPRVLMRKTSVAGTNDSVRLFKIMQFW